MASRVAAAATAPGVLQSRSVVRIEAQGLVAGGGKIVAPGKIEHPRPAPRRHLARPVRRAGVHHDNLIAQPLDRIQTPAQRLLLVADDQGDG